jgi:fatty-acyl-CoA synthase
VSVAQLIELRRRYRGDCFMTELSVVKGRTDTPLIEIPISRYFNEACARHAEREALVSCHQSIRLSFAQLRESVDALACSLTRWGLAKGDRLD